MLLKKPKNTFVLEKNWPSFSISFVLEGFLCSESKSDINPYYKKRGFSPRFIDPKNAAIGCDNVTEKWVYSHVSNLACSHVSKNATMDPFSNTLEQPIAAF